MKTYFKIAASALLIIALLCACSTTKNTAKPENVKELPRYEELSALIGLSAEEVEQKMQWELTETEPAYDYIYQTPIEVEFCGVDLRVELAENKKLEKINSVLYRADYTNDNEKAAEDILKIAKHLGSTIGKDTQLTQWNLFDMTKEEMLEVLGDNTAGDIEWDITSVATQSHKEYMELHSDWWKAKGRNIELIYGLEIRVTRVEDTVYLEIGVGPMLSRAGVTMENDQ